MLVILYTYAYPPMSSSTVPLYSHILPPVLLPSSSRPTFPSSSRSTSCILPSRPLQHAPSYLPSLLPVLCIPPTSSSRLVLMCLSVSYSYVEPLHRLPHGLATAPNHG